MSAAGPRGDADSPDQRIKVPQFVADFDQQLVIGRQCDWPRPARTLVRRLAAMLNRPWSVDGDLI
jgi:hypothetical protein